ncbi:hypothetical protein [Micromonospora olivasterospora]|uniref:Peptidase inhibitor family I36 n=1 Tax=Micromonospora olivasterospora TaxID=1880 RepID=A0A562I5S2_MICOL|nr:hypothetical protein [Micromonospora olivasterospora]TWH66044.1 hypothetical protein JD77_00988 [Micromonospora olivasterospora]
MLSRTARTPRLLSAGLLLAATVLVGGAAPASASADTTVPARAAVAGIGTMDAPDNAVPGSPPTGLHCTATQGVQGCFKKYGDQWWVQDTASDVTAYAAVLWENHLRDGSGSWGLYRSGECNNRLGDGRWGVCNKDYWEDSSHNAWGGYGSRLRWRSCGVYGCTSWSNWVYNDL